MLSDPTMLTKDIARMLDIQPRTIQRPAFKRKLGLTRIARPRHGGRNNIGRLGIPESVHPLVKRLYQIINRDRVTGKDVSVRAGLCGPAIYLWRKQMPRLDNFEAALNVLGYKLAVVPIDPSKWGREEADG